MFRATVSFGMIVVLAACGTPPLRPDHLADPDKRKIGRVSVLVDSNDPQYEFDAATRGKGEGAAKGAGEAALGSFQCGVLVIVCLPLSMVAGAAIGAIQAKSESDMANLNSNVRAEIHDLAIPGKVGDALEAYVKQTRIQSVSFKLAPISHAGQPKPDYAPSIGEADLFVEIRDLRLKAYTTGREGAPLALALGAHVRVIQTANEQLLDEFQTTAMGYSLQPEEWLQGGAAGLSVSIGFQAREIAETVLDELTLVYHPATMDPTREKVQGPAPIPPTTIHTDPPPQKELVPGYALRTVYPPFRNHYDLRKTSFGLERYRLTDLQPTFEWETFPRNFDVTPGNEPWQARNLHYDFRVFGATGGIAYERFGLDFPRHKIEVPLNPCELYRWTARATFDLNGSPRVTEWTGGYSTNDIGPWVSRRGMKISGLFIPANYSGLFILPNNWKYPIVITPSSNGGPCPAGD